MYWLVGLAGHYVVKYTILVAYPRHLHKFTRRSIKGDEWIDEEDVEEEIWELVRKEQRVAAQAVRRAQRDEQRRRQEQQEQQEQQEHHGSKSQPGPVGDQPQLPLQAVPEDGVTVTETLLNRVSSGLAHKLFRHRLPNAVVPIIDKDSSPAVNERFVFGSIGLLSVRKLQ